MLALILFFIAGAILGIVGLRLMSRWEASHHRLPTNFRHHS